MLRPRCVPFALLALLMFGCGDDAPPPRTAQRSAPAASIELAVPAPATATAQLPPPPPPELVLEPAADATCILHPLSKIAAPVTLTWHGKTFGTLSSPREVEARLRTGNGGGTLHAENASFVFESELPLSGLELQPRDPLVIGGWLTLKRVGIRRVVDGGRFEPAVRLPEMVRTREQLPDTLSCASLALMGSRTQYDSSGEYVTLKRDASSPLRLTPSGTVVAIVLTSGGAVSLEVGRLLERRKTALKLRIENEHAAAEGWVDASMEDRASTIGGVLGGYVGGVLGGLTNTEPKFDVKRCTSDVPIYVRDGSTVMRVGHAKREVPLYLDPSSSQFPERRIFLERPAPGTLRALMETTELPPFVRDLSSCNPASPP